MNPNDLIFLPSYSLSPNKLVSYNSVFYKDHSDNTIKPISQKRFNINKITKVNKLSNSTTVSKFIQLDCFQDATPTSINKVYNTNNHTDNTTLSKRVMPKDRSHNFEISTSANRNLKQKINWLYYLSKARYVKTYSGKSIFNFKMCFLTLTLPSKQKHSTKECTKLYLNTFLTEIKERTGMNNYVWRLEFQKNGNVHYHLCTDTYLDYYFTQKIWNRVLDNYGYIKDYQDKFKNISLSDYNKLVNQDSKKDFKTIAKRYAKGKKTGWRNPPTIDVKSVVSNKSIANYISKYFSKDSKSKTKSNELDNDSNSSNLRLWFCSRSLSKLKTVSGFNEQLEIDIFSIIRSCKKLKEHLVKYAKIFYFELSGFEHKFRAIIEKTLKSYSLRMNYIPA